MELIDTHTHLYLAEFEGDSLQMLERARKAGVKRMFLPAIDSSEHGNMLKLEGDHEDCVAMMGLHPCSVKDNYEDELKVVGDWLGKRKFVAVGEIGLDFYWDLSFVDQQYDAFRRQCRMAMELGVPIVIHSRNATDECIGVVREMQKGGLKGIFHCFSGNAEQAKQVIDLGFYLGIGGVVTYKNSGLDKVVEGVSLDWMVLETDAPYLSPVPFRGKRNESAYLVKVVDKIAEVKGVGVEEVARVTTLNAQNIFRFEV